jgi:DNA mismatch repair protein MutL
VRFREERRLFGFMVAGLREAVARTDIATPGERLLDSAGRRGAWIPRPQPGHGDAAYLPDPGPQGRPFGGAPFGESRPSETFAAGGDDGDGSPWVREGPGRDADLDRRPKPFEGEAQAWRSGETLVGPFLQVARTYIVRALPDGFEIVDQHALHERLTYEGLRAEARAGRVAVQRLLVPEVVDLSRDEIAALSVHLDGLERLGIELTLFGPKEVAVQGMPARLPRVSASALVRDLVALLEEHGRLPEADDLFEDLLHRSACRSSIMAGDELSQADMRALLERAGELESDQTCPHARPTRVRFTLADLEKAFHRR